MIIVKKQALLRALQRQILLKNGTTGFVPTMGALHAGHLSLVSKARQLADTVIASIFINPTQFNDPRDFVRYPQTLEADIRSLEAAGVDLLFLPSVEEMYPGGLSGLETYDLGDLETRFEGKYRPGHFQGVCQVMFRLLRAVDPDVLVMGQKDYQQCLVVEWLLRHLKSKTTLVRADTVREANGLAMSSRNLRLSPEQREKAGAIFQALVFLREHLEPGPTESLQVKACDIIQGAGLRVDYLALAQSGDLNEIKNWDGHTPLIGLAAAYLGEVRLIDNLPAAT